MALFSNPVVLDLLAKYKPIAAMAHTSALLGWDLEINMPEAGAAARGQAQAEIDLLRQKMTLDLTGLIEKAEKQKTLNDSEKGVCLLYTSPSPRDLSTSRMPSSA